MTTSDQQKIRSNVLRLRKTIQIAEVKIAGIREICPHPDAIKTHKSNTGNYDPTADCYWTEFKCPDCGHFWHVDGSV